MSVDVLKKTVVDKLPSDLEGLEGTIERLQDMIDTISRYVDNVIEGQLPPDNAIGRYLADTIASVPRVNSDAFDKLFNDSVQDVLLVLYLANLTRTQLTLAEKLNTAAQIV
jgi:translation initiation factor 3 subunit F